MRLLSQPGEAQRRPTFAGYAKRQPLALAVDLDVFEDLASSAIVTAGPGERPIFIPLQRWSPQRA